MKIKCPNCEYEGTAKKKRAGSLTLEIFGWFFFLLPGVFYTIWRFANRRANCPKCHWKHVVIIEENGQIKN
jgi:ssDNA-binding Zn-finger/Zn-ribbon topoisomerase 1